MKIKNTLEKFGGGTKCLSNGISNLIAILIGGGLNG